MFLKICIFKNLITKTEYNMNQTAPNFWLIPSCVTCDLVKSGFIYKYFPEDYSTDFFRNKNVNKTNISQFKLPLKTIQCC